MTSNSILDSFIAMGSWQAALSVLIFIGIEVGFWLTLKHWKMKFIWRILIGMSIGLIFGLVIQAISGFPANGLTNPKIGEEPNPNFQSWVFQLNLWVSLFGNIFISGIKFLIAPVVFISIFKVLSKPNTKGVGRITFKGVGLLLFNVLIMFSVTFWLGYLFKIGDGVNLVPSTDAVENKAVKALPEIIWQYFPTNLISPWLELAVIPLMIAGALFGHSVKILSKRNKEKMDSVKRGMDIAWDITTSMLITFIKIMPLAVMSMIASSIIGNPIGSLVSLGKTIGVAYLAIFIGMIWLTMMVIVSRLNVIVWWRSALKVIINGFTTQSSSATLPRSIEILKDEMKVNDKVVSTVTPLSTSMGLMGCAGVQSGIITSLLWTSSSPLIDAQIHSIGLFTFFIMALVITVIASIGIAGVPGTASVVSAGVLGALGLAVWINPVTSLILSLEGILDMGRTGLNVAATQAVVPIVAKSEGLINDDSELITDKQKEVLLRKRIKLKHVEIDDVIEEKPLENKTVQSIQKEIIYKDDKNKKSEDL